MNAAEALRGLSKIPESLLAELAPLPYAIIKALVDWLDGDDEHPEPTEALERLPSVLKSELALARAEERARRAPQG